MSEKETTPEYDVCELHHYPKVLFCDATKESLCYACATTPKYNKYYTAFIENLKGKTERCHQECKDKIKKLACGMEDAAEGRKKEITKIDEQVTKMMKGVDSFYNKVIERIEGARRSDMECLEAKRIEVVDGLEEDIRAVESFIERVDEFKERFTKITEGNINSFTEGVYKSVEEIKELRILKEEIRGRCGRTYEMEFLRSNDAFNQDIYKCIESLQGGFCFNEFQSSEYLCPSEGKERDREKESAYEYKGDTGFGLREKDYYNQKDNTFHTDIECRGAGSGSEYKHFYDIMKDQPQRLEGIKKDISRACQEMSENAAFDTEKRDTLFQGLAETKAEIVRKFGDVVVSAYEARTKAIEELECEFSRRNSVYERTLNEEKKCVRDGINWKRECEETGMWFKHACQSWEKSNKSIQEYIQKIGALEKVRDVLVSKKGELERDRNVSFRMVLISDNDNDDDDDDDDDDGYNNIRCIPHVEYVEFDEAEERAEFIKAVRSVREEDVLSLFRRGVQDITAVSLAINYHFDKSVQISTDEIERIGCISQCVEDNIESQIQCEKPLKDDNFQINFGGPDDMEVPIKCENRLIQNGCEIPMVEDKEVPFKVRGLQNIPKKTSPKEPQTSLRKSSKVLLGTPIKPKRICFEEDDPVHLDLRKTPKKSPNATQKKGIPETPGRSALKKGPQRRPLFSDPIPVTTPPLNITDECEPLEKTPEKKTPQKMQMSSPGKTPTRKSCKMSMKSSVKKTTR